MRIFLAPAFVAACAAEPFTSGMFVEVDAGVDAVADVAVDVAADVVADVAADAGVDVVADVAADAGGFAFVPGGSFVLGREEGAPDDVVCGGELLCDADEVPGVVVTVEPFLLDRFEVKVGSFRVFVGATGVSFPTGCGPQATWTPDPGENEKKPINCVSWADAKAFCTWDGGTLPTEAEWELAASGGEDRVFPWSSPPSDATIDQQQACYAGCGAPRAGASSPGAGRWGHEDLAGNVWEWVLDWYGPYSGPVGTAKRVARGGDYGQVPSSLRAVKRAPLDPEARYDYVGFRCARPLQSQ